MRQWLPLADATVVNNAMQGSRTTSLPAGYWSLAAQCFWIPRQIIVHTYYIAQLL